MALILSAIETVHGILFYSYSSVGSLRPENIQSDCNARTIVNYGFAFAIAQAAVIGLPWARASVRSRWFLIIATVVTVNLALLVLLCNLTARHLHFP